MEDVRTPSDKSDVCHWGQCFGFFQILCLFSDVAFGGEAGNVLVSDPLQVQPDQSLLHPFMPG